MKTIYTLLLIFNQVLTFGQKQNAATLQGNISNVFLEPNKSSESVYKLKKNEVFFIVENIDIDEEWLEIQINPEKYNKAVDFITGFVKKTDVIEITDLNENNDKRLYLTFKTINAIDSKFLNKEQLVFGLETSIQESFSIEEMKIFCNDRIIQVDEKYYNDLYNIRFNKTDFTSVDSQNFQSYTSADVTFFIQNCGDGAGSYDIIWVIKDCSVIQRLINEI